jgi:cell division protein ZapA (FtsZ GTPase activity inhibitor)
MADKKSSRPSEGEVKRLVEVSIDGKPISFRSDAEQAYLDDLATFFEARFNEVGSRKGTSPYTQAVLAALNITEELFRERGLAQELREGVKARCQRIQELLDNLDPDRRRG